MTKKQKKYIAVRTAGLTGSIIITLPRPFVLALGIEEGDQLLATLDDDHIRLELAHKSPTSPAKRK